MKYTFTRVINTMYEEECALLYGDDFIMQGDSYHDKIYEKIDLATRKLSQLHL